MAQEKKETRGVRGRVKPITIGEIRFVSHELAKKFMEWDEPIPSFEARRPGILESCVAMPFQVFSGKVFYRGLVAKAAILFYLLIKNHPFENGNKRVAVATLLVFLYKNGRWLSVDHESLYEFARWVAASNAKLKAETVAAIEKFVGSNISSRPGQ